MGLLSRGVINAIDQQLARPERLLRDGRIPDGAAEIVIHIVKEADAFPKPAIQIRQTGEMPAAVLHTRIGRHGIQHFLRSDSGIAEIPESIEQRSPESRQTGKRRVHRRRMRRQDVLQKN